MYYAQSLRNALKRDPDLLDAVYQKTDHMCWYCGSNFDGFVYLPSIDHVIELVHGGTNDFDNLVPCCTICNSIKGDRGAEYLRARLACRRIMEEYEAGADITEYFAFYGEGWPE